MSQKQTVSVGGHRLSVSSLDKVMYPETGTTKADVFAYYAEIAPVLIPHVRHRPATRKRWVDGVGTAEAPGGFFFQKDLEASAPSWVKRRTIEHSDHTNAYPLVNDDATLAWLAQVAALEIHVPQWRFGPRGARRNPDRLVLDLDPGTGAGLPECVEVAKLARRILQGMDLEPVPVTSGSKGIHLYAALDGTHTSEQVTQVARELARALEADHPELIVSDMKRTLRAGKVLIDWSQNSRSKTTIAPYSLRGRMRPTVAAPRTWRELGSPRLRQLEYTEVLASLRRRADPLAAVAEARPARAHLTLPRAVAASVASAQRGDRLDAYRSKRDANRTPEPVPDEVSPRGSGQTFVIQEHHASSHHYDLRLERDGVLVSWAVPKGIPTDARTNHLAVKTEDHPLEYAEFEGVIPVGEYGAGTMSVWDAGTYQLEKWRDGREIIVTLLGDDAGGLGGTTKIALIRTRDDDPTSRWLLHRMDAHPAGERRQDSRASTRKRRQGARYAPMLASVGERARLDQDDWAFEMKWDGIRVVAYVDVAEIRLLTRHGTDVTTSFPEIVTALRRSVREPSSVLDGEIVAVNARGRPDFGLLQDRLGARRSRELQRAMDAVPVRYFVFDAPQRAGRVLVGETYAERRGHVEQLVGRDETVQVPPSFLGSATDAVATSRELGLEGVIAKRRDSTYRAGRRSSSWLKFKNLLTQEVVIGGWRPGRGSRDGKVGSLLMGVPGAHGLTYVGRVGTGFSERALLAIRRELGAREVGQSPFADVPAADARDVRWVSPELVGEVEFAEWTAAGRLRQPSWRGWRTDKLPDEVTRESSPE